MRAVFKNYLLWLRQDREHKTDHSDRGPLETLLNVAAHAADPNIRIIHEAKKVAGSGAPDFKVMKAAMILGYVENKTVGENLDQVLKSDQIARYKALSKNILLTDYLQFIRIKDGKVNGREFIAYPDDLAGKARLIPLSQVCLNVVLRPERAAARGGDGSPHGQGAVAYPIPAEFPR